MALTKINFYLGFLASYAGIMVSLLILFNALLGTSNQYMGGTQDFVDRFTVYNNNIGNLTIMSDANTEGLKTQQIITVGNETGESSVTDNLAVTNYYASRINYIPTYISLAYNAPSYVAYLLIGDNYESMRHIVNIFTVIIFISLVILFIREVRG